MYKPIFDHEDSVSAWLWTCGMWKIMKQSERKEDEMNDILETQ